MSTFHVKMIEIVKPHLYSNSFNYLRNRFHLQSNKRVAECREGEEVKTNIIDLLYLIEAYCAYHHNENGLECNGFRVLLRNY